MRPLPRLLIGFTAVVFASLAAVASETPPTSNAEPTIVIRCDVAKGVILKQVIPVYPAEARTKGIQGLVRISVRVNKHGVPEKLRALSGPPGAGQCLTGCCEAVEIQALQVERKSRSRRNVH